MIRFFLRLRELPLLENIQIGWLSHLHIQWVTLALSSRPKPPGHEAKHSLPSIAEIKNAWSYIPIPHTPSWQTQEVVNFFPVYRTIIRVRRSSVQAYWLIQKTERPVPPFTIIHISISCGILGLSSQRQFILQPPVAVLSRCCFQAVTHGSILLLQLLFMAYKCAALTM